VCNKPVVGIADEHLGQTHCVVDVDQLTARRDIAASARRPSEERHR